MSTTSPPSLPLRRLPIGAEVTPRGTVHFRVWAEAHERVEVVLESTDGQELSRTELAAEEGDYFAGEVPNARVGSLYRYRMDETGNGCPDPASRFQPFGPHGPSQVVDPGAFQWSDAGWRGVRREGQVIYEMHVGTFTREGTWEAAGRELPELASLGVTILEVMPVADFAGTFGWGYDGVDLFAPTRLYGTPDDFRRFVDRAHAVGLGVILDVVYNHLGPDGNYLKRFAESYFSSRHTTDWGEAINFDGPNAEPVRELFVSNAGYWIDEFHLDGLRADATQNIYDESPRHILADITARVRAAAGGRGTLIVGENEPQDVTVVRPIADGGYGQDGVWNDDFHHSAMVALTGRDEAYYTDYCGTPQELVSAAKYGFLYQGQFYKWQKNRRGTPTFGLPPTAFVHFLQNHDQVANSFAGDRVHMLTSRGRLRAMTALLLLGPQTPMLFQGQEFAASTPFLYFADHESELAKLVIEGRRKFLAQFVSLATPEMQAALADPSDRATFEGCKLDFSERVRHAPVYALHRDLLRLRREDPVFAAPREHGVDGAVLSDSAFVLRFFGESGDDRLLVVNLGRPLHLNPAPQPLLAPRSGMGWELRWTSEHPRYGGLGTPPIETPEENWRVPGETAVVLGPGEDRLRAKRDAATDDRKPDSTQSAS